MTIIYVVGVISGSLFHSVASPCTTLAGASGGLYALIGKNSSDPILYWQYLAFSRYKNVNLEIRCRYKQNKTTQKICRFQTQNVQFGPLRIHNSIGCTRSWKSTLLLGCL